MLDNNTLYVYSEKATAPWLKYILEEFIRIQGGNFDFILTDNLQADCHIYYGIEVDNKLCIPDKSKVEPSGEVTVLKKDLFIVKDTQNNAGTFGVSYDIFWNAFVFLSRREEFLKERNGKKTQSYSINHPRVDKETFLIPIVNVLFNELESLIVKFYPYLKFSSDSKVNIELSHDLDYISKTIQLRGKQTAFNLYNTIKSLPSFSSFLSGMSQTLKFLLSTPSYWRFNDWVEMENSVKMKSVFYIYSKVGSKNFTSWLIDPSYNINTNDRLKNILKELKQNDFEIGLHGSYYSATDMELQRREKEQLENSLDINIAKGRQHWLRYEELITPAIHNKLFQYDSTIGWNDRIGFRSGVASHYRPYDHFNDKPYSYFITPLVIMDSNLYDYGKHNFEKVLNDCIQLLNGLKNYKNVNVSISWHQRTSAPDYKWHNEYCKLLFEIEKLKKTYI